MMIKLVASYCFTNWEGKPQGFYNTYISLETSFHLKQADAIYIFHPQVRDLALVRPSLECCIQLWGSQHKEGMDLLEGVQMRAMELRFILEKRRIQLELRAAFPYLKGPARKLERKFSQGDVMIGQGVMALN